MPTSYYALAVQYGHEETHVRDTLADCNHREYADEIVEREDGFKACFNCSVKLDKFEEVFGEEADISVLQHEEIMVAL